MGSPQFLYYDGARVSSDSSLGKELLKWEKKPDWTPEANPFPKMLYRAQHRPDGRRSVGEVLDSVCGGYPGAAEQWTRRCQITVNNEAEMQKAMENGWRKHPKEALDYLQAEDDEKSVIALKREQADSVMSEPARRESAEADASTLKHVAEIPEKRLVKKARA